MNELFNTCAIFVIFVCRDIIIFIIIIIIIVVYVIIIPFEYISHASIF